MKKFFAVLFGIILLVIFVALVVVTFFITTLAKIMTWITGLTLPMNKFRGFSGYARTIVPRYRLMGLPDPTWGFRGLDFTQKPNFCNHISKLLKNFGEQAFESILLLTAYRSPMLSILCHV